MLGASQNYTCTIGDTARLFFRRSDREHLEDFMKYRAWKENISFAVIEKGTLTAICSNHVLKPFCLAKVQFQVWNKTHLLLKIINTNYEDSGEYGVQHVFGGLEGNDKNTISLKIQGMLVNEIKKPFFNHETYDGIIYNVDYGISTVNGYFKSPEKCGGNEVLHKLLHGEAPPHHLPFCMPF